MGIGKGHHRRGPAVECQGRGADVGAGGQAAELGAVLRQQGGQGRPAGELLRQLPIGQQLQAGQGGVVAVQPVEQAVVGRRRQQQEGLGHQPAPGRGTGGALAGTCCSQTATGIGWFWA